MTTKKTIAAINAEIQRQEQELKKLREELATIEKAESPADDQELLLSVLSCPHTVTHESITLRFNPKQEGYNALAQLHNRLAAYDAAAKAREMELLAVIEDLERLIPLVNQGGGTMSTDQELLELTANSEALQLIVKYELGIYRGYDSCRGEFTEVLYQQRTYAQHKSCIEYHKDHPSPIEATRRAIGRAASAIEKATP